MTVIDERMAEAHELTKETTIILQLDDDADNPRIDHCNVGTMACYHHRYNLGDEGGMGELNDALCSALMPLMEGAYPGAVELGYDLGDEELPCPASCDGDDSCDICGGMQVVTNDFYAEDTDEMVELYSIHQDQVPDDLKLLILPLYLYDHGGITMSTGPFGCRWDSGQVGWIFTTGQRIKDEWGGEWDKAKRYLEGEVEIYDQYLRGDIWGFEVWRHEEGEDAYDGELLDSCWGFYGGDPKTNGMHEHWQPEWCDIEPHVNY